ncbi:MAG: ParB N-terminal domain-containing protein [Alteromonadaceae bacterium]|nr:ParB N-terminal domain-containing protein [Alteromonadaceae bacterium]
MSNLLKKAKALGNKKKTPAQLAAIEKLAGHYQLGDKSDSTDTDSLISLNNILKQTSETIQEKEKAAETSINMVNSNDLNISPSEAGFTSTYSLPSGRTVPCRTYLLMDPKKDTKVWIHNPRYSEDPPIDDIKTSILSTGTNMSAALVFRNGEVIDVITGSRRRKACITVRKPFQVTELWNCPIDDAKQLALLENEGNLKPHVFSVARGYKKMLEGDTPVAKTRSDLARLLSSDRAWITQIVDIMKLPLDVIEDLMPLSEKYKVEYKPAIKMQKRWKTLNDQTKDKILARIRNCTVLTYENLKIILLKELLDKEKSTIFRVNVDKKLNDNAYIVSNTKMGKGLFIKIGEEGKEQLLANFKLLLENID